MILSQHTLTLIIKFILYGIEFPIRKGYQVEPENADKGLPELEKKVAKYSLKITSVANSTDEEYICRMPDSRADQVIYPSLASLDDV